MCESIYNRDRSFIDYIKNISMTLLNRNKDIKENLELQTYIDDIEDTSIYCEDLLPYKDGVFTYNKDINIDKLLNLTVDRGDILLLDTNIKVEVIDKVSNLELQVRELNSIGEEIIVSLFDIKEIL